MDSQDALAYGEIIPENQGRERARIVTLCEWAKGFNVDGFVRYGSSHDSEDIRDAKCFYLLCPEWKWTCKSPGFAPRQLLDLV